MSAEVVAIDASGVAAAPAPAPEVAAAAPEVAAPAPAAAPTITVADLSGVIAGITADLSGASLGVGELVRYIPRLAAHVQTLPIAKAEKRDLVIAAGHLLVDQCVPESARETAHGLVDSVFPFAIAAVVDVARGRIQFANPAQAVQALTAEAPPVVQEVAQQAVRGCLPLLARLVACVSSAK